ncbi:MAG: lipid A deacylase LpxR family protein [Parvularculaceae bacterium]|nr:lipid A deacylase LpxR family protein [Parvularculaceae bacterium]
MKWTPSIVAAAAAAAAFLGAARAEPAPPVYSIVVENDVFDGSDQRYTSGIKHQWLSAEGKGARLARLLLFADDDAVTRFGAGAGQSLFTPDTLGATAPLPDQHPYAGWLYLEAQSVVTRRRGATDILKVAAGVVGPAALGEETQRTVHRALNFIDPAGWDNQLRNEPGLLVSFDRVWRFGGPKVEVMPYAGASLGNVLTEARGGAIVRIGSNLGATGLPARVSPARPSAGAQRRDGFAWQVYGGATGRAVAQNIFLDGNTFRDSLSVDKEPVVAEVEAGASLQAGRIALGYAHVWRTREFETETGGHAFGAVTLSAAF